MNEYLIPVLTYAFPIMIVVAVFGYFLAHVEKKAKTHVSSDYGKGLHNGTDFPSKMQKQKALEEMKQLEQIEKEAEELYYYLDVEDVK